MAKMRLLLFLLVPLFLCGDTGRAVYTFHPGEIAQAETAQQVQFPTSKYETSIVRVFFSFIGLLALVVISFWLFRRFSQGKINSASGNKTIKILERKMLSPKSIMYLVEVEGKKIFLVESHLEVKILSQHSVLMAESSTLDKRHVGHLD